MSVEVQIRATAAGNESVGGATVTTVVLDRDLAQLTGPIRGGVGEELQQCRFERTLEPNAAADISLRSASNTLKDAIGRPLQLQDVRMLLVTVVDPVANKLIRYGPQGIAQAAPLWFASADSYQSVAETDWVIRRSRPVAVAADAANLRFTNSGSVAATIRVWVVGRMV